MNVLLNHLYLLFVFYLLFVAQGYTCEYTNVEKDRVLVVCSK